MISFVWSAKHPFMAGSGGSENYTAGQIRELMRRGIPTRIITIGHGENDGREDYPDITFTAMQKEDLSKLDDTLVFVTYPLNIKTKRQSYAILHCPPLTCGKADPLFDMKGVTGKQLMAPSKFAAKQWRDQLKFKLPMARIPAAYPFAETCFSKVKRKATQPGQKTRVLFAGRLTPDKGIYTLLTALHMNGLQGVELEVTATTAYGHSEEGQVILKLLEAHPWINLVPARKTPEAMAELMAEHDVVVMPSTNIFWYEAFGILSVEAQHAGCRVVASNAGGLPETDCGGLVLVKPDDPQALAEGMAKAIKLGPLTATERARAAQKFTVATSVDKLLKVIETTEKTPGLYLPQKQSGLVWEQFDVALGRMRQLGLSITRDEKLAMPRTSRPTGN